MGAPGEHLTLPTGSRLGAYEIVAPLGSGGFGDVYKARDTRLDRTVAIKVLPSADPDLKARFEREAKAIAALQDPHICALHDVGQHEGVDFLVLEFLDGETLAARIAQGPLKFDDALTIAFAIASALDRAHRAGVVHRDLKPENVMLTRSGAKLLDFGLAKLRPPSPVAFGLSAAVTGAAPAITARGSIVGTLHYMSPEQCSGEDADARSDIWAFGCVLFEMLTGRKAFDGSNPASVIGAIMHAAPSDPTAGRRDVPAIVAKLVATCLTKDPDQRFQSAHDLCIQLRWIADGVTIDAAPATPAIRTPMWASVAMIAMLAAIVIAWQVTRGPASLDRPAVSFLVRPPDKTVFPAAPMFLTVSPDGTMLAFVAGEVSVSQQLFVQPLNSTDARAVPGTENIDQPFWSADSRSLAFVVRTEKKLKRVDLAGGPPRVIADVPAETLQGGTWNENGDILFGVIGGGNPLFKVSAAGGKPVPVTTLDRAAGELAHMWPHFLPDGDRFLFTVPNADAARSAIFMGQLSVPGSRRRIVDVLSNGVYSEPGLLLFVREQTLLAQRFDAGSAALVGEPTVLAGGIGGTPGTGRAPFAASRNGILAYRPQSSVYTTTLTWVDRRGTVLGTAGPVNGYRAIALSPDASRVAVQVGWTVASDIWVGDLKRDVFTRLAPHPANDESPVWSPDGSRVAFASNRDGGVFAVYETAADGSDSPRLLFKSALNERPVQWSRDGRWILAESGGVRAFRLDDPREPIALGAPSSPPEFAAISPDGAWVAYAADEMGKLEVSLQRFPSPSGTWRVSTHGGSRPHWRGDGRELFFVGADSYVYAVPIAPGTPPVVGNATRLFAFRTTSPPRGATRFDGLDVTADGQRFLVNMAPEESLATQSITVRVNWPSAVKDGSRP